MKTQENSSHLIAHAFASHTFITKYMFLQHPFPLALESNLSLMPSNHLPTFCSKGYFISKAFWVSIQLFSSGGLWTTASLVIFRGGLHVGVFMDDYVLCDSRSHHPDRPGLANFGPWAKSRPPPAFVNNLWLEHSHICSFMYYLWLLSCYNGRAEELQQKPYGL